MIMVYQGWTVPLTFNLGWTMDLYQSLAGFVVGAAVGLTGVGGGSLMTPLLVLLFGVAPATAVGTDLLYASITKTGGIVVHGARKTIDWGIVGWMAAGSIPASLITMVLLGGSKGAGASHDAVFKITLGVMLILTAAALLFRRALQAWAARSGTRVLPAKTKPFITVALGAFLGVAVSLSSVGAGAVGVTALVFLFPTLAAVRIVGTDLAHAVPLTLVAGLGHAAIGNVDWILLGSLLLGSLPGVALGSHLAARMPEQVVRHSLVLVLLATGGRLVFR